MKRIMSAIPLLAVLLLSHAALAKGPTSKLTIQGAGLRSPIEITNAAQLAHFGVWTGPGVSINGIADWNPSFADWKQRAFPYQTQDLPRYEVSFYAKKVDERVVYTVTYAYDPKSAAGFIYIPAEGQAPYRTNVLSIRRGVEGNWFRASSAWDNLLGPLLEKASRRNLPTASP